MLLRNDVSKMYSGLEIHKGLSFVPLNKVFEDSYRYRLQTNLLVDCSTLTS